MTSTLALPGDIDTTDDDEFTLNLTVVLAEHPVAKLRCDTSDGCGSTCSGSACSSYAG